MRAEPYGQVTREIFPFRVFIKDDYLKEGLTNEFEEIMRKTGVKSIKMDG